MPAVPPFRSDNTAGACDAVLKAIANANQNHAAAYGQDELSAALNEAMSEVFERRCWCFPVATGTAANALALSALCEPGDVIACHTQAHILRNEDSAVQYFAGAVRMEPLPGDAGRLDITALNAFGRAVTARTGERWSALSLTQLTEAGTLYSLDDTASLAEIARSGNAQVHMDGSRFANAVVSLQGTPADLSWRRGVDILSFGATKNDSLNADAIVVFEGGLAARVKSRQKRSGHLYSKMRFMAAQLLALLKDDRWLRNAEHANHMATRLGRRLSEVRGVKIRVPVEGNHVFINLGAAAAANLEEAGLTPWQSGVDEAGCPVYRLVTSYATQAGEIERFVAALHG